MEPLITKQFIDKKNNRLVGEDITGKVWEKQLSGLRGTLGDFPWTAVIGAGTAILTTVISKPASQAQSSYVPLPPISLPTPTPTASSSQPGIDVAAQVKAALDAADAARAKQAAQQLATQQAEALAQAKADLKAAQETKNQVMPSAGISNQTFMIGGAAVVALGFLYVQSQNNRR